MLAAKPSDDIIVYCHSVMNRLNAKFAVVLIPAFYFATAVPNRLGIYSQLNFRLVLPHTDQFTPYEILILPIHFALIDTKMEQYIIVRCRNSKDSTKVARKPDVSLRARI